MEYIQITLAEQHHAKRHLLYSEMEILTIMKRYHQFGKLRSTEIMLKNALRRKLGEINEEMQIIDRILPNAPKQEKTMLKKISSMAISKKRRDLEIEIDEIKRKLERLQ